MLNLTHEPPGGAGPPSDDLRSASASGSHRPSNYENRGMLLVAQHRTTTSRVDIHHQWSKCPRVHPPKTARQPAPARGNTFHVRAAPQARPEGALKKGNRFLIAHDSTGCGIDALLLLQRGIEVLKIGSCAQLDDEDPAPPQAQNDRRWDDPIRRWQHACVAHDEE